MATTLACPHCGGKLKEALHTYADCIHALALRVLVLEKVVRPDSD